MSAAIMHTTSIYHECSEFMKNQTSSRTGGNVITVNNNNPITNSLSSNNSIQTNSVMNQLNNATNILNNNLNLNQALVGQTNNVLLQQQLNVVVAAQQQQQEQKILFHNALSRAVSHPQNCTSPNVVSLMNTIIENLGTTNGHRKLERTQSEPLPQQVNTSRYKTELCRPFEEAGECKYGEKCQFAHGYHELRNLHRHPKYKTEYCRTFHSVGFCPYGPRCHFVHNMEEARFDQPPQQQQQQQLQIQPQQQSAQSNQTRFNNGVSYPGLTAAAVAACFPNNHSLPLSPPLSMSTGSDRASPTGSLSLSPTNSMASFPFGDQISPVFPQTNAFNFNHNTPPESPVNTPSPPPSIILQNNHKPSSPISIVSGQSNNNSVANSASSISSSSTEEARLPVFNRLSSTIDAFSTLAI